MTITVTTPVTGGPQAGFTAPTYTTAVDLGPDVNAKQYAVTALGGTQAGVTAHVASSPFLITYYRPKVYRTLGKPNPITGVIANIPKNVHRLNITKGISVAANQAIQIGQIKIEMVVPSGSESYDPANIRAMVSAAVGALNQISSGLGDTLVTNLP